MNTPSTPQAVAPSPMAAPPAPSVKPAYRLVPWIVLAAALGLTATVATRWEHYEAGAATQTTNNASVQQETAALDAKVGAYVRSVNFSDFQAVKAGDVLVELVDDDYRAALARAQASLDKAEARLDSLDTELAAQQAAIDQAVANAETSKSRLALAEREHRRFAGLSGTGAVTGQEADAAHATFDAAQATYRSAVAAIEVQRRQHAVLAADRKQRSADVESARAALASAQINLDHTRIVAPAAGYVGARAVQPGSLVSPGTQVVSFVSASAPYIIANYKETQLARIAPGQAVSVEVDSFPGTELHGRVTRIAPASGSTFAIVPADNATGNFTKVVQRVPVRIDLEAGQAPQVALRAGMSVTTRIHTEQAR